MRGKSNVIKINVEKVWGARYLPKNTVIVYSLYFYDDASTFVFHCASNRHFYLLSFCISGMHFVQVGTCSLVNVLFCMIVCTIILNKYSTM
jgi:hypothetical protein